MFLQTIFLWGYDIIIFTFGKMGIKANFSLRSTDFGTHLEALGCVFLSVLTLLYHFKCLKHSSSCLSLQLWAFRNSANLVLVLYWSFKNKVYSLGYQLWKHLFKLNFPAWYSNSVVEAGIESSYLAPHSVSVHNDIVLSLLVLFTTHLPPSTADESGIIPKNQPHSVYNHDSFPFQSCGEKKIWLEGLPQCSVWQQYQPLVRHP